ncbi:MAG: hypothetical protein ABWY31_01970, partial [Pseudoxanthomonas sp.]
MHLRLIVFGSLCHRRAPKQEKALTWPGRGVCKVRITGSALLSLLALTRRTALLALAFLVLAALLV